jgi:Zn-dependent protease
MFFAILLTISRAIAGGGLPATGRLFACCMMINVFLAAFNMLPIPPLDGSHVLSTLLPHGLREAYERLRSLGYLLLFGLLMLPVTSDLIYGALGAAVRGFMLLMGVRDLPQGAFNPMSLLRDDT